MLAKFSHDVYLGPSQFVRKRNALNKFKIFLHYDDSIWDLPKNKQEFIQNKLLPNAVEYWQTTLKVKRSHRYIKLLRQCKSEKVRYIDRDPRPYCFDGCSERTFCGEVEVPDDHLEACRQIDPDRNYVITGKSGNGVEGFNFILYVSSLDLPRCKQESTVAYAAYCKLESQLDRPVAGYVNLCPEGVSMKSFDEHQMHFTIKHEILHALGFSSGLFAFFRDSLGQPLTPRNEASNKPTYNSSLKRYEWSDKVVQTVIRPDWLARSGAINKSVNIVVTPAVVREVRRHFNCQSAEGAELEDQGMPGTSLTHWEKRMFENEAMTGTYTQNPVISRITLALMEDTGWYYVNYEMAGNFEWGRNMGCDFIKKSCHSWMISKRERNESIHPFCERIKSKSIQTECNQDNTAVALCNLIGYPKPLADQYQHFTNIPGIPDNMVSYYGGSVELADFCPYVQEFNWKKDDVVVRGSRCSLATNNPAREENYLMEEYGKSSMCFEHSSGWTVQHCDTVHQVESWGSGCYKFLCDKTRGLQIIFGNTSYWCIFEAQVIKVRTQSYDWLHRGTIVCPQVEEVCPEFASYDVSSGVGNVEEYERYKEHVYVPCAAVRCTPYIPLVMLFFVYFFFSIGKLIVHNNFRF